MQKYIVRLPLFVITMLVVNCCSTTPKNIIVQNESDSLSARDSCILQIRKRVGCEFDLSYSDPNIYKQILDTILYVDLSEFEIYDDLGLFNKPCEHIAEYKINNLYVISVDLSSYYCVSLLFLVDKASCKIIDKMELTTLRTSNHIDVKDWDRNGTQELILKERFSGQLFEEIYDVVFAVDKEGFHEIFKLKVQQVDERFYPEFPIVVRQRSYLLKDNNLIVSELKGDINNTGSSEMAKPQKIVARKKYVIDMDSLSKYTDEFVID